MITFSEKDSIPLTTELYDLQKLYHSGGSGQERLPETSHPDADYLIILRHQAEVEDLHPPSMRQATVSTSAPSAPPLWWTCPPD